MTTTHLKNLISAEVPQNEALREDQVPNSAGGFAWEVNDWTKLRRFLILGTEGGTYYISERNLTKSGTKNIERCLKADGKRTVDEIVAISESGRAPKNDYALFALATVVAKGNDEVKRYALDNLSKVARIGTHLFQFVEFLDAYGTLTGRAKRRALAEWYTEKETDKLAYQLVKYRQRNGWTHRDVLRIAHPGSISPVGEEHAELFNWVTNRDEAPLVDIDLITGFEAIQTVSTAGQAAEAIRTWNLPREAVPTEFLTSPEVWQALLDTGMPMTAMIRNLANMTRIGLLTSQSSATKTVLKALGNEEVIKRARVHPISVLFALRTYQAGRGFKGQNTWTPVQKIVDALDDAFYLAFGNVEPTGKRTLLALDVSSSMTWGGIGGTNITPAEGSAAMALVTAKTEEDYEIFGFADRFRDLGISPRQRLDDVVRRITGLSFGGTDCSLPMQYAEKNKLEFDTFVVYTDSETWAGRIHPSKALVNYRKNFVPDARLIVVGMQANDFSIADPNDAGMLDVCGFDTATPNLISDFARGLV